MRKKAILPSEVMKIIVAVLCLVLLLYLANSVYDLLKKKSELEQAKASLDTITAKINSLKDGEELSFPILSPKKWYIVSYKKGETSPKQCGGENCLCMCRAVKTEEFGMLQPDYFMKEGVKMCDSGGVCKNPGRNSNVENIITFDVPSASASFLYNVNWISLEQIPVSVSIALKDSVISIFSSSLNNPELNQVLARKIKIPNSGREMSIEEAIKSYIFNNCYYTSDSEVKPFEEVKAAIEEDLENYIGNSEKGFEAFYLKDNEKKNLLYVHPSFLSAIGLKKICAGNFEGYIELKGET